MDGKPLDAREEARCRYTLEYSGDSDECVGMRPACCPAEPEAFNTVYEPYCRYCGKLIVCDIDDDEDAT